MIARDERGADVQLQILQASDRPDTSVFQQARHKDVLVDGIDDPEWFKKRQR